MFELISREPRYRGKDRFDNTRWITGMFASVEYEGMITPAIYRTHEYDGGDWVGYDVIENGTLCESSHLRDSDGVEIFEGDILEVSIARKPFGNFYEPLRGVCVFENGCFCFSVLPSAYELDYNYPLHDYIGNKQDRDVRVIGNIFDNPELLNNQ